MHNTSGSGSFSKSSACLLGHNEEIEVTGFSFFPPGEELGTPTLVFRGYGLLGFLLGRGGGMSMS